MINRILLFLILSKPLIDLSWNWKFYSIRGVWINLQRVVAFSVPTLLVGICFLALSLRKKLFLKKDIDLKVLI